MIGSLIVGVVIYFLFKRLIFGIETRTWSDSPFKTYAKPEDWTYVKSILLAILCLITGYLGLIVYIIIIFIITLSDNTRFKKEVWFNKQSKL